MCFWPFIGVVTLTLFTTSIGAHILCLNHTFKEVMFLHLYLVSRVNRITGFAIITWNNPKKQLEKPCIPRDNMTIPVNLTLGLIFPCNKVLSTPQARCSRASPRHGAFCSAPLFQGSASVVWNALVTIRPYKSNHLPHWGSLFCGGWAPYLKDHPS